MGNKRGLYKLTCLNKIKSNPNPIISDVELKTAAESGKLS